MWIFFLNEGLFYIKYTLSARAFTSAQSAIPLAALQHYQRLQASGGEQQRPVLCHRSPLPNAALRHYVHRSLQVENEQVLGLLHVPALLCVSCRKCYAGGQNNHLPCHCLIEWESATRSFSDLTPTALCLDHTFTHIYKYIQPPPETQLYLD